MNGPGAAAIALVCAASLSCGEVGGPADFAGTWHGYVSGYLSESPSAGMPVVLDLRQSGARVTGTIGSWAIAGTADRYALTFSVDFGDGCGTAGAGSGLLEPLPDRQRLRLDYASSSACSGTSGTAWFERLTSCPAPRVACAADYVNELSPYCADVATDPENCGGCGVRCSGSCIRGACEPPR